MADQIPVPLTNGTAQGGPNGTPPVQVTQPASDAAMIAQDVANKYPNQAPAALTSGTPQMPTQAPQGPTSTPTSTPPTPQTPHEMHQSMYQRALSILAPPTRYLDAQGNPQQTRPSLSNSILSGAIAGLLTPTAYRQGTFGPIADTQQTAANAFAAGKEQRQEQDASVQKHVEDVRSRKLQAVKDNADTVHLHMGVMQDAANMRGVIQTMNDTDAPLLKMAEENDKNLDPNDPNAKKAIWGQRFTMEQALQHPEWAQALTQHTLVHDGMLDVPDANGNMIPTPTYTIIDPSIKANMTKEAADIASQIYPSWKSAFEGSNGSMQMRLGQLSAINNQVNSVKFAEKVFQDAADSDDKDLQALGIKKDVKDTLMHAVRQGTQGAQQALQALMTLENAKAANGTPADVLNRLINDPDTAAGRGYILNALGITAEKAQDYIDKYNNERIRQAKLAQESGDKAPADPAAIAQIPILAKQMGLSPAEVATASAELPKTGATRADVAKVLENIRHQHDTNAQRAAGANRDQGDPAMIDRVARNLVDNPASLTTMRDIGTRGTQRLAIIDRAEQIAKSEGKQFDTGLINQRVKFLEQYEDPKGKAAINRQAINNIMQHAADVSDLNQLNRRSNVKIVNTPINELKNQFGDQVFTQYQTANGVLKDELGLYFAGGYSPTKDQQAMWDKIQADTATPAQTEAFAKEVVRLATRRADTFNEQFKTNMGYDDPNILTPQAKAAAERLGLGDAVKQFKSGGQLGANGKVEPMKPYTPVTGDRPIMKNGNVVGYLSPDGTRHNL